MNSPILADVNCDDEEKYIAEIYFSSGLPKEAFSKIYLDTLKKYFSKINPNDNKSILIDVSLALKKRRGFYFPDGVEAEDVHFNKDVWTFVVFLSGLLIPVKENKVDFILSKILNKKVFTWLEEKNTLSVIRSICDEHSDNVTVQTIRNFYVQKSDSTIVEDEIILEPVKSNSNINEVIESIPPQLSNKEVGKLFLLWVYEQPEGLHDFIILDKNSLTIKSPEAFMEFSKLNNFVWKHVQKGVFKWNIHKMCEESGTPFHKHNNTTVMLFPTEINMGLCN